MVVVVSAAVPFASVGVVVLLYLLCSAAARNALNMIFFGS